LTINQTICQVREIAYLLPTIPCDRCRQPAARFSNAERVAIDLDLDRPTLLLITVSVHFCVPCRHYFRAQPPFLRPDASYTNRVVATAVAAVYNDRMAMRRVPDRLARDFWIRPSEASIRQWCHAYRSHFDFVTDYQPWVVQEFSGVLCVDEVYQGQIAILFAVDPAAPDGDRLMGYQLLQGDVDAAMVEHFTLNKYTSQEIRGGCRPADARSDLYALGAIWYDLTLRRPGDEPILLPKVDETALPDDAKGILRSLLAPQPNKRPASAKEVSEWLELLA